MSCFWSETPSFGYRLQRFPCLPWRLAVEGFFVNPTLTSLAVYAHVRLDHRGADPAVDRDRNLRRRQHQGSDRKRDLDDLRLDGRHRQQGRSGEGCGNHIATRPGPRPSPLPRGHSVRYFRDHGKHRAADCHHHQHHHSQPGRGFDRGFHRAWGRTAAAPSSRTSPAW